MKYINNRPHNCSGCPRCDPRMADVMRPLLRTLSTETAPESAPFGTPPDGYAIALAAQGVFRAARQPINIADDVDPLDGYAVALARRKAEEVR